MNLLETALALKYRIDAAVNSPAAIVLPASVRQLLLELAQLVVDLTTEVRRLKREGGAS